MNTKLLTPAALFALLLTAPCAQAGAWSFLMKESVKLGSREVLKKSEQELAEHALRSALRSSTKAEIRSLLAAHGEEAVVQVLRSPANRKLMEELGEDAGNALLRHGCVGGDLLNLAPTKEAAKALQGLDVAEARALLKQAKLGAVTPQNAETVLRVAAETPHTAKLVSKHGADAVASVLGTLSGQGLARKYGADLVVTALGQGVGKKLAGKYGAETVVKLYHNPATRSMVNELGEEAGEALLKHGAAGEKLLAMTPTKESARVLQKLEKTECSALAELAERGAVTPKNAAAVLGVAAVTPKTADLINTYGSEAVVTVLGTAAGETLARKYGADLVVTALGQGVGKKLAGKYGAETVVKLYHNPATRSMVNELGEEAGEALLKHGAAGEKLLAMTPTKESARMLQGLEKTECSALAELAERGAVTPKNAAAVLGVAAVTPKTSDLINKYGSEAVVTVLGTAAGETLARKYGADAVVAMSVATATRGGVASMGTEAAGVLLMHGAAGKTLYRMAPTAATIALLKRMTPTESQALAAPLMRGVVNKRNMAKMAALVKEYPKTTALLAGWGLYKLLPKDESGAAELPAWVPTPIADGLRACGYFYKVAEWGLNHPWCAGGCALLFFGFNGSLGYFLWQLLSSLVRILYRRLRVRNHYQRA